MAGELILVNSTTVTSDVSSVTLTGIDTTYDIYKVLITNARPNNTSGNSWRMRWIVGGSPEIGNNYFTQYASHNAVNNFQWSGLTTDPRYSGNTLMYIGDGSSDTGECYNANINLYKAYDNNSEARWDIEQTSTNSGGNLIANKGGGYRKAKQTCTGVQIFVDSYSIASGFFGLYGYNYS